jgi:hypothetical protein
MTDISVMFEQYPVFTPPAYPGSNGFSLALAWASLKG